jgi:hypothetical protein
VRCIGTLARAAVVANFLPVAKDTLNLLAYYPRGDGFAVSLGLCHGGPPSISLLFRRWQLT